MTTCELFHDNFQNFKQYNIPKAQLILVDIPYNVADNFYASRPDWYIDGDNKTARARKLTRRHSTRTSISILPSSFISPLSCSRKNRRREKRMRRA